MKVMKPFGNHSVGLWLLKNCLYLVPMHYVGEIIRFDGTGDFSGGIECQVLEVHPDDNRVTKMKALIKDDRLGRMGFILEGEDWVAVEWDFYPN